MGERDRAGLGEQPRNGLSRDERDLTSFLRPITSVRSWSNSSLRWG